MDSKRFQDLTEKILQEALETTKERRKQYGDLVDTMDDVFTQTADIFNTFLNDDITGLSVIAMMVSQKLARYGRQVTAPIKEQKEATIRDSALDAIVYIALMESTRRLENVVKETHIDEDTGMLSLGERRKREELLREGGRPV